MTPRPVAPSDFRMPMSRVFSTTIMKKIARMPKPATAMIRNNSTLSTAVSICTAASSGAFLVAPGADREQLRRESWPATGRGPCSRSTPGLRRIWIALKLAMPVVGSIMPRSSCSLRIGTNTKLESYSFILLS